MSKTYRVRVGDCLHSIAERFGFSVDTIWDHPDNAALKELRGDPGMLVARDEVAIPDLEEREASCAMDQTHRFVLKSVPVMVRVRLFHEGEPRANQEVDVKIDGAPESARTDGDGVLELTVAPRARRLELRFPEDGDDADIGAYELTLGAIPPADTLDGVRARLENLGYDVGAGEALDATTEQAIRSFQMEHELDVSGRCDDATVRKLEEIHDAPGELAEGHPLEVGD